MCTLCFARFEHGYTHQAISIHVFRYDVRCIPTARPCRHKVVANRKFHHPLVCVRNSYPEDTHVIGVNAVKILHFLHTRRQWDPRRVEASRRWNSNSFMKYFKNNYISYVCPVIIAMAERVLFRPLSVCSLSISDMSDMYCVFCFLRYLISVVYFCLAFCVPLLFISGMPLSGIYFYCPSVDPPAGHWTTYTTERYSCPLDTRLLRPFFRLFKTLFYTTLFSPRFNVESTSFHEDVDTIAEQLACPHEYFI